MAERGMRLTGWRMTAGLILFVAGAAGADLQLKTTALLYPTGSGYGTAVGTDSGGDVWVAGTSDSTASGDAVLMRCAPGLTALRWTSKVNVKGGAWNNIPTAVAVRNGIAYVAGTGAINTDDAFLLRFDESGNLSWQYSDFASGPPAGMMDMKIDPVDGTIWAIRTSTYVRLLHFKDNGNGFNLLSDTQYTNKSFTTQGYGLAVTADAVYVVGSTWEGATNYPWVTKIDKASGGQAFSTAIYQWIGTGNWFNAVTGRDNLLYAVQYRNSAAQFVVRLNPASGEVIGETLLEPAPDYYNLGKVVVHPTQNRFFGVNRYALRCFNENTSEFSSMMVGSACPTNSYLRGVGVYGGLFPEIYAVGTNYGGGCAISQGIVAWHFNLKDDNKEASENIIVAPNYIDRSRPGSFVNIWIKSGSGDGGTADVLIYDAAGKLVRLLHVQMTGGSSGNVQWDGTTTKGELLAPGTYWATFPAEGVRKPLMIVKKRSK